MNITDDNTCKVCKIFADNVDTKGWVYSYGGCGTNYLRKVFRMFKFAINNHEVKHRLRLNTMKSII
jgi:hypothetical protein